MAMTTMAIVNAMTHNYQGTLNAEQLQAINDIAVAIIDTVKELTITYTTGLIAPPGGGPVTGVLTGVTIT